MEIGNKKIYLTIGFYIDRFVLTLEIINHICLSRNLQKMFGIFNDDFIFDTFRTKTIINSIFVITTGLVVMTLTIIIKWIPLQLSLLNYSLLMIK